ncbi:MAG TPA: cytochrome c-type biogenesis CcmF C-terminal domain-containing protein [Gemmatimonadaceae bacterium]|nr:cytochrome c-type biogenesis CcmF C-terminal domain-containing protein [Gemmatimonadaceae bacterium]
MTVLGEIALWLALLFATWSAVVAPIGAAAGRHALVASAARGLAATSLMTVLAAAGVIAALARRDYELAFAAATTSHDLPTVYAIAALWAAPAGAALVLALPVAAAGAVVALSSRRASPWAIALVALAVLLCLGPLCFTNALYERLPWVAADGQGLAPRLQSAYLLIVPPLSAIGYGLLVPYLLLEVGSLVVRHDDAHSRRLARQVALLGWAVLGASALVALRWAYLDPVWWDQWPERVLTDGSLVAWLTVGGCLAATGRRAVAALAVPAVAAVAVAASVSPLGLLEGASDALRGTAGAALVVLTLALAAVAWRAHPPAPSTTRGGRASTLARRVGLGFVAAGVVAVAVGLAGRGARVDREARLETGRAAELTDPRGARWRLVSQGVSRYQSRNRDVTALAVMVGPAGDAASLVTAERWQVLDRRGQTRGEPVSVAGVRTTPTMDVRLLLETDVAGSADVRVGFEPFALLVWIGGTLLLVGGAAALAVER